MTLNLQERSGEVDLMAVHWPIVSALMGGTHSMRAASKAYLPQWPKEEDDAYKLRRDTSTLFPAFRRTLGVMASKPFTRQLTIGKTVPEEIQKWLPDINLEGQSLHAVASSVMIEALAYGLCGVLVEHTLRPPGVRNDRASERMAGLRPYFTVYEHDKILGWRSERVNGRHRLTQLRLLEMAAVEDGAYDVKSVRRVRLLTPGAWQLYEEVSGGGFTLIDEGVNLNMTEIPFVPFYGRKLRFMFGESPLLDMAYLNVKHWQSQSDQDYILHVARVPILAVTGVDQGGVEIVVGGSSAVKLPPGSSMGFVEHSGAAIASGAQAIDALEKQMIQAGAELLVKQAGQRTATESANDAEANKSELLGIVELFEDSLDQCLQFMADWMNLTDGGNVTLFKDFSSNNLSDASAQLILALQQGGMITKETAVREEQRRGVLSPDIDPALELEAVASEGPALGTMESNASNGQ